MAWRVVINTLILIHKIITNVSLLWLKLLYLILGTRKSKLRFFKLYLVERNGVSFMTVREEMMLD